MMVMNDEYKRKFEKMGALEVAIRAEEMDPTEIGSDQI